ncbi:MAG: hypothetical protein QNJ85_05020 [Gammaproteobacteria bacterium]|nr:hypothetical protein [Gammaproteobacteria bacterium]
MKAKLVYRLPILLLLATLAAAPVASVQASDTEAKREQLLKRLKIRAQNCAKIQRMQCVFSCARSMSLLNQGKLQELQEEMKKCKAV